MGKFIEIYGIFHNNTPDDKIALAKQIYDEKNNKTQEEINNIALSKGDSIWATELFGGVVDNNVTVLQNSLVEKVLPDDVLYKRDIKKFIFRKQNGLSTEYYDNAINGNSYNNQNVAKEKTYFINNDKIYYFNGTELMPLNNVSNVDIIHAFDTSEIAKNKVLDAYVVSMKINELENTIKELVTAKVTQDELVLSKQGGN